MFHDKRGHFNRHHVNRVNALLTFDWILLTNIEIWGRAQFVPNADHQPLRLGTTVDGWRQVNLVSPWSAGPYLSGIKLKQPFTDRQQNARITLTW